MPRKDNETLTHGWETGVIDRSPDGGYAERHAPLPAPAAYALTSSRERLPELEAEAPEKTDANGVRNPKYRKQSFRQKMRAFYYSGSVDKPTSHDMEHAAEHLAGGGEHPVVLGDDFQGVSETGVPRVH